MVATMNNRSYVLVFDDAIGTRRKVLDFLDQRPEILNWYTCMSNAVLIVSDKSADELTKLFRTFTQDRGRFLIINASDSDRNGWLPQKAWRLIRNADSAEHEQHGNK